MPGALNLTRPAHLLAKLEYCHRALATDHGNSYVAIDALRDAYHLREWVWHDRLERDTALQIAIIQASGHESLWNAWVNQAFPDFPIIRELCNGSKHFEADPNHQPKVQATHQAGYGSSLFAYGTGILGYDIAGFFVQLDAGRIVSIENLIEGALGFWLDLFKRFPQLA
jgi:hypothetical protein